MICNSVVADFGPLVVSFTAAVATTVDVLAGSGFVVIAEGDLKQAQVLNTLPTEMLNPTG